MPPILPAPAPESPLSPSATTSGKSARWRRIFGSWRSRVVFFVLVVLIFCGGFYAGLQWSGEGQDRNRSGATGSSQQTGEAPEEASVQQGYQTDRGLRFGDQRAATQLAKATSVAGASQALQDFFDQYQLTVEITTTEPSFYAKQYGAFDLLAEDDLKALKAYGAMLIDEWSKYPYDWVTDSQLKSIVLVKNLKVSDAARAAMPDPIGDALYYDITYGVDQYAREVLHHEYNHVVEFNFYNTYNREDTEWKAFNPAGFKYGEGGASAYTDPNYVDRDHPSAGFVSEYAKYALEEDKAELFAYLMTDNYDDLEDWAATDSALAGKVNYYKRFIRSVTPEMSGSYFDQIND